jgi:hypothetical protein
VSTVDDSSIFRVDAVFTPLAYRVLYMAKLHLRSESADNVRIAEGLQVDFKS